MASLAKTHLIDVDRKTGAFIQGWERIKQSINTILSTRLRTRLMRLKWGSTFLDMQDKPLNEEIMMSGIMAAIQAVNANEPEFYVDFVQIGGAGSDGLVEITLSGIDLIDQQNRRISTTF